MLNTYRYEAVQSGLGKDIWTLTPDQINEFFKVR